MFKWMEKANPYPEYDRYYQQQRPGLEQYNSSDDFINRFQRSAEEGDSRPATYLTLGVAKGIYAGIARATVMKLVAQMSASADVLALSSIEVDISKFAEGTNTTVKWRGKPIFIKHRTPAEIALAQQDDNADLRHKETDASRVQKDKWLVVIGICTHLGCVPIPGAGDYPGGFFCPCHGSHYDASGRIRKGPAPLNLEVPTYKFLDDKTIFIG